MSDLTDVDVDSIFEERGLMREDLDDTPARVMRTLDESDFVHLVELAIGNPCRSVEQQDALERMAGTLDNPFVLWSYQAQVSWTHVPCAECDAPVCRRFNRASCDRCLGRTAEIAR